MIILQPETEPLDGFGGCDNFAIEGDREGTSGGFVPGGAPVDEVGLGNGEAQVLSLSSVGNNPKHPLKDADVSAI